MYDGAADPKDGVKAGITLEVEPEEPKYEFGQKGRDVSEWPRVSVAISAYNQRQFIAECLDSVLCQDYPELEIVVSDDNSTDGTREILEDYAQRESGRIKLILPDVNLGIPANYNRLLHNCTGEYIAWLDGDDLMLPGKIRRQVKFMRAHPECVLSYHDMDMFDSSSGQTLRRFNFFPPEYHAKGTAEMVILYGDPCFSSCMTLRSAIPNDGFDTRLGGASDRLFVIDVVMQGRMRGIQEILGRYRRHGANYTTGTQWRPSALVLHDVIEAKYPQLTSVVQKGRARQFYMWGVEDVQRRQWKDARRMLLRSLNHGWVSWKWLGWYARALAHA